MSAVQVQISVDTRDVDHELDRLDHGFNGHDLRRMDAVLMTQFVETMMDVHIRTASLLGSARMSPPETRYHDRIWSGQITYGGDSPGSIHDPVRYAIYEYARGGPHDFLKEAKVRDLTYLEPIRDYLAGR